MGFRPETSTSPSLKKMSRIGKSIFIKGEITLNENLTVDGRIVGKIEIIDHQLDIGPSGIVHAEILAKNVTIEGKLVGIISASGMVTIQSTGSLVVVFQLRKLPSTKAPISREPSVSPRCGLSRPNDDSSGL